MARVGMNVALSHLFDVLFRLGLFDTEAAHPLPNWCRPDSAKVIDEQLQNSTQHRYSAPRLTHAVVTVTNSGARSDCAPVAVVAFSAGPHAGSDGEPLMNHCVS
jgi:hypothetical protein